MELKSKSQFNYNIQFIIYTDACSSGANVIQLSAQMQERYTNEMQSFNDI